MELIPSLVVSQFEKSCQPCHPEFIEGCRRCQPVPIAIGIAEGDYEASFDKLNLTVRLQGECIFQTEILFLLS